MDLTLSAWNTQWRGLQWPATQPWGLQGSARLAAAGAASPSGRASALERAGDAVTLQLARQAGV
ncbi:hypothetical protein [Ideonella paludis]